MTDFLEMQFPTDISYGATGGPMFLTDVVTTISGREQRNSNWTQARAKYNVAHAIKTEAQWLQLIAFFRVVKGKAFGFRYKDWSDYKATGQNLGTGDGAEVDFQLVKRYTFGSGTETRTITKPVDNSALKIYVDAVEQMSGYTVDFTTGIVTFDVAPEVDEIITADFEFDTPVRFDTDELDLNVKSFEVASWDSIPLVEVRV